MAYFTPEFIDFFKRLSRNNKREWFHAHKKEHEAFVKKPFEAFVGEMIHRIGAVDPAIAIEPKEAIFRIARDTRFSKDKTPYKTHAAAIITPGGRKNLQYPGLYFQFSATGIGVGGGLYQPDKGNLYKIRQAIVRSGPRLARALQGKQFRQVYGQLLGDRNKRLPKEFAAAAERFPFIANKGFFYYAEHDDPRLLLREDLAELLMRHYRAGSKVSEFLKGAIRKRSERG